MCTACSSHDMISFLPFARTPSLMSHVTCIHGTLNMVGFLHKMSSSNNRILSAHLGKQRSRTNSTTAGVSRSLNRVHPKNFEHIGKGSSRGLSLGFGFALGLRGRLVHLAHNRPCRSMRLVEPSLQGDHVSDKWDVIHFLQPARGMKAKKQKSFKDWLSSIEHICVNKSQFQKISNKLSLLANAVV